MARRGQLRIALALLGIACVVATCSWLALTRGRPPDLAEPIITPERAVAVLRLRGESTGSGDAWLSTALPEILAAELGAAGVDTVPRESVERMQEDLDIGSRISRETLARIRANVGADLIVVGSYASGGSAAGSRITINLEVLDASDGSTVSTVADAGSEQDLIALARRSALRIREELNLSGSSPEDVKRMELAMPRDVETLRLYAEGLSRLRSFDSLTARGYLERAVAADPSFALAHTALSDALAILGNTQGSIEHARTAHELSKELPARMRLPAEETFLERKGDWAGAAAICKELIRLYPSNLDYGLSHSYMLARGGRVQEAFGELARLRTLPRPLGSDPRIDLAEAWFADEDVQRRLSAARRAGVEARRRGARTLLAMSYYSEANALERLGRLGEASQRYDMTGEIRAALGDRAGMANALCALSTVLVERGEIGEGVRRAEQAREVLIETGDKRGMPVAMRQEGAALLAAGRLHEAERTLLDAARLFEALGEMNETLRARQLLGTVHALRGEIRKARALFEAILDRESGGAQSDVLAEASLGLAGVHFVLGEAEAARALSRRAIELRRASGDEVAAMKAQVQLAEVESEAGLHVEGVRLASDAVAHFSADGRRDWEAEARRVLALALRGLGRGDESRAEIARARELADASESPMIRARVAIASDDIGYGAAAGEDIEHVIESTAAASLRLLNLEARIVRASGAPAKAADELAAIEREAARLGWARMARVARARRQ